MNAELYDALVDAGAGEEKARAAAGAIGDVNTLATKADLKAEIADVKAEIADVKTALAEQKTDILKWMVGAMIAQAGLVVALILGLLPLLLR
jgi:type IV secretory pathway component VirB8